MREETLEYQEPHFEICLECDDGEHQTTLPFPLSLLHPGEFLTLVCETCGKRFGITLYAGVPFLDPREHPKVRSLEIRELFHLEEVEDQL